MSASNPAFETAPDTGPAKAQHEQPSGDPVEHAGDIAKAMQRLPADICAALTLGQIGRLAMLVTPKGAGHEVSYQISTSFGRSRYYFALFFGREKRSDGRLRRDGQKRSFGSLLVRLAMIAWLLSSAVFALLLIAIFGLYAAKSVLGIDLFDGHFFMHPLLFKLGLLPGAGV